MQPLARRTAITALLIALTGCASPGVPRSPSLNLPEPVRDLTATRQGDTVTLRFTLPQRNTDHLPLRGNTISARLCRALEAGKNDTAPCTNLPDKSFPTHTAAAELHDTLPAELLTAPAHPIAYRIELLNESGHTAGFSDATYVASGPAPERVENLTAQGSRLGTILTWKSLPTDDSEIVLRREDLNPKPPKPESTPKSTSSTAFPTAVRLKPKGNEDASTVLFTTDSPHINQLLDTTALADEPYRYTIERRRSLQFGGRTLELRSEPSTPVSFTLHDTYPPPVPTDLTAATSGLAVDLIWQPVDDPGLAGYNIYRQPTGSASAPTRLNQTPIPAPGYHDDIPSPAENSYTYAITAIDKNGNESSPCITAIHISKP